MKTIYCWVVGALVAVVILGGTCGVTVNSRPQATSTPTPRPISRVVTQKYSATLEAEQGMIVQWIQEGRLTSINMVKANLYQFWGEGTQVVLQLPLDLSQNLATKILLPWRVGDVWLTTDMKLTFPLPEKGRRLDLILPGGIVLFKGKIAVRRFVEILTPNGTLVMVNDQYGVPTSLVPVATPAIYEQLWPGRLLWGYRINEFGVLYAVEYADVGGGK